MAGVAEPLLHAYVPPPPAVMVAMSLIQMVTAAVIVGETEFTVTLVEATSVHPVLFETITEYVPDAVGVIVIDAVVEPSLHE